MLKFEDTAHEVNVASLNSKVATDLILFPDPDPIFDLHHERDWDTPAQSTLLKLIDLDLD